MLICILVIIGMFVVKSSNGQYGHLPGSPQLSQRNPAYYGSWSQFYEQPDYNMNIFKDFGNNADANRCSCDSCPSQDICCQDFCHGCRFTEFYPSQQLMQNSMSYQPLSPQPRQSLLSFDQPLLLPEQNSPLFQPPQLSPERSFLPVQFQPLHNQQSSNPLQLPSMLQQLLQSPALTLDQSSLAFQPPSLLSPLQLQQNSNPIQLSQMLQQCAQLLQTPLLTPEQCKTQFQPTPQPSSSPASTLIPPSARATTPTPPSSPPPVQDQLRYNPLQQPPVPQQSAQQYQPPPLPLEQSNLPYQPLAQPQPASSLAPVQVQQSANPLQPPPVPQQSGQLFQPPSLQPEQSNVRYKAPSPWPHYQQALLLSSLPETIPPKPSNQSSYINVSSPTLNMNETTNTEMKPFQSILNNEAFLYNLATMAPKEKLTKRFLMPSTNNVRRKGKYEILEIPDDIAETIMQQIMKSDYHKKRRTLVMG